VAGDRARSRTYARVYHVSGDPADDAFYECMGEYDDSWERTPDGWRLQARTFNVSIQLGDPSILRPRLWHQALGSS